MIVRVKEAFSKIDPKYGNIPILTGDSAFTENKEVITLCLIDPESKKEYDFNTVMYVALHELSHVISNTVGHGDEFKTHFSELRKERGTFRNI